MLEDPRTLVIVGLVVAILIAFLRISYLTRGSRSDKRTNSNRANTSPQEPQAATRKALSPTDLKPKTVKLEKGGSFVARADSLMGVRDVCRTCPWGTPSDEMAELMAVREQLTAQESSLKQEKANLAAAEEKLRVAQESLLYQEKASLLVADSRRASLEKELENRKINATDVLGQLWKEKTIGFPWLADAFADFSFLQDEQLAQELHSKGHPAPLAADAVRQASREKRKAERLWRIYSYQMAYYESLFPWLVEFRSEDIDDLLVEVKKGIGDGAEEEPSADIDPARHWLAPGEYAQLPVAQRNQLALDRYMNRHKSKWEIGRDYERFVGYGYEQRGYSVTYQGIVEGFADLGRDLVAEKDGQVEIVQCKYWSRDKTIHEKHIFQLYGTAIEYWIKHCNVPHSAEFLFADLLRKNVVSATFVTLTVLSEQARKFADTLGIRVVETYSLEPYPIIKCNVSHATGERIYHLPFDQMYDKTTIDQARGECYVSTVKEAEAFRFRRAKRWLGGAAD